MGIHGRQGRLLVLVLANAPYAIAFAGLSALPAFLRPMVVGWTLFIGPGLAWTDRRPPKDPLETLFSMVARSVAAAFVAWIVLAMLPGLTSRAAFIGALAAAMNAGLVLGWRRGWYAEIPWASNLTRGLVALSAAFYMQTFVGAAYRVPALEDQDMEVQGTAYGLIHAMRPTMVTNRGTTHFFAHPPLLHFWIGASMLLSGDLDRVRYYHDAAVAVRGGDRAALDEAFRLEYARFEADPVLLPTRTPNVIAATLTVVCLVLLLHGMTSSSGAALLGGLVYATLPEVYVRSAYGGYMSASSLFCLFAVGFYMQRLRRPRAHGVNAGDRAASGPLAASAFSGLTDQKTVIIAAAGIVHGGLVVTRDLLRRRGWRSARRWLVPALLLLVGFWIGWGAFAGYGLVIAPGEFVTDHLRTHIADRLRFDSNYLLTPPAGNKYPSIAALWLQFAEHLGWLVIVPAIIAAGRATKRIDRPEGILVLWLLIGAVGFSLVDWRQTKHLALVVPPLVLLTAAWFSESRGMVRVALAVALGGGVAWNIWRIGQLMLDFGYLVPYRMW